MITLMMDSNCIEQRIQLLIIRQQTMSLFLIVYQTLDHRLLHSQHHQIYTQPKESHLITFNTINDQLLLNLLQVAEINFEKTGSLSCYLCRCWKQVQIDYQTLWLGLITESLTLTTAMHQNFCMLYDLSGDKNKQLFFVLCKQLSKMGVCILAWICADVAIRVHKTLTM